jgi:hypothetical protein
MEKSETKKCAKCEKKFLVTVHEKKFYEKQGLPFPKNCSECRRERRKGLRNERKLHKRTCDKCGVKLVSTYPSDSPYVVYCEKCYFNEHGTNTKL